VLGFVISNLLLIEFTLLLRSSAHLLVVLLRRVYTYPMANLVTYTKILVIASYNPPDQRIMYNIYFDFAVIGNVYGSSLHLHYVSVVIVLSIA
jgi:hypothetical protein